MISHLLDWFDLRTGYRALVRRALYEELPSGTGWAFTTGSVVTLLVGCQFITGVGLSMYYVPAPSLAYDSVRFIMDDLPLGWLLRGLHYWGASFLVVAAVVHLLRVFFLASYKAPREVTWLSGVLMLLVILGFSRLPAARDTDRLDRGAHCAHEETRHLGSDRSEAGPQRDLLPVARDQGPGDGGGRVRGTLHRGRVNSRAFG